MISTKISLFHISSAVHIYEYFVYSLSLMYKKLLSTSFSRIIKTEYCKETCIRLCDKIEWSTVSRHSKGTNMSTDFGLYFDQPVHHLNLVWRHQTIRVVLETHLTKPIPISRISFLAMIKNTVATRFLRTI